MHLVPVASPPETESEIEMLTIEKPVIFTQGLTWRQDCLWLSYAILVLSSNLTLTSTNWWWLCQMELQLRTTVVANIRVLIIIMLGWPEIQPLRVLEKNCKEKSFYLLYYFIELYYTASCMHACHIGVGWGDLRSKSLMMTSAEALTRWMSSGSGSRGETLTVKLSNSFSKVLSDRMKMEIHDVWLNDLKRKLSWLIPWRSMSL